MDASVCDSRPLLALAVVALSVTGTQLSSCANEIDSPSPDFTGKVGATSKGEALAYPGFVCSAQQPRWVEVHGKNFAPVPLGTMNEDDPQINWPEVTLTRVQTLDGEAVSGGISVRIQATGRITRDKDDEPAPDTGVDTGGMADTGAMDTSDGGGDGGAAGDAGDASAGDAGTGDAGNGDAAGDTDTADADSSDTGSADTGSDAGEPDTGGEDTGTAPADDPKNIVWLNDTTLRFKVNPEMHLKPGFYDITVTAARVSGELQLASSQTATAEKAFGILPPPQVDRVGSGEPICVADSETQITLTGNYFLKQGERLPTVAIGDRSFEIDEIGGCNKPAGPFGPYEVCNAIKLTVPQNAFPGSSPDIHVENFAPAGCENRPARDGTQLRVVEPPVVSGVRPDPICSKQTSYEGITITGENFVRTRGDDGAMPAVKVGDYTAKNVRLENCTDAPGKTGCSTIRADIEAGAVGGDSPVATHEVSVTNPEAIQCGSDDTAALTSIAPPSVDAITPGALVGTQSDTGVVVRGSQFAVIDGKRPTVAVSAGETTNEYTPTAVEDCDRVDGPGGPPVNICGTLEFDIPADDFTIPEDGDELSLDVQITNPAPLSCQLSDGEAEPLTVLKPPTLTSVDASPICTDDQTKPVTLTGTNFAIFDGTGPRVAIGMNEYRATGVEGACETVTPDGASAPIEVCSEIQFEVPEGELLAATHPITVYNPDAVGGATTTTDIGLTVVGQPRVSFVEPALTCVADGARTLTFHGDNFIRTVDGMMMPDVEVPSVDVGQTSVAVGEPSVPDPEENCTDIRVAGSSKSYQRCSVLEVPVQYDGAAGLAEVTLTNPGPADCSTAETVGVEISPKPEVTSVQVASQSACNEPGYRRIAVGGNHLLRADGTLPTVTIGSQTYEPLEANNCTEVAGIDGGELAYCDELIVYGETPDVSGTRSVSVQNPAPSNCPSGSANFDVTANCP